MDVLGCGLEIETWVGGGWGAGLIVGQGMWDWGMGCANKEVGSGKWNADRGDGSGSDCPCPWCFWKYENKVSYHIKVPYALMGQHHKY